MAKENTYTGPYDHDIGQGSAATISERLDALREGGQPAYLNPVVGTASTPDTPNVYPIGSFTVIAKFKVGALGAPTLNIASQRLNTTQISWSLTQAGRTIALRVSANSTSYTSTTAYGTLPVGIVNGATITVAGTCILNNGSGGHSLSTRLLQANGTWLDLGDPLVVTGVLTLFNSTAAIMIGAIPGGSPGKYDAPIYWVEMRNGTNPDTGPLVWRFDAADWQAGLTLTSASRVWTLSVQEALSPKVIGAEAIEEDVVRAQALDRVASNGSKITGEYLFVCREMGAITQEHLDELLGPAAFPGWPVAGVWGYKPMYVPEWWPIEHGEYPAFQVKRVSYGASRGGDFVRGSTDPPLLTATITNVAVPVTNVATITTSAPHKMFVGDVIDVSGVTTSAAVYNGRFKILTTPTTTTLTYAVISGVVTSAASPGRVDKVNPRLPNAVLKYPTSDPEKRAAITSGEGQALLYVQPAGYDSVKVEWLWPAEIGHTQNWKEVSIVRSMFGAPTTPNDGQTIYGPELRMDLTGVDGNLLPSPVLYDNNLTTHLDANTQPTTMGGYWFYYTIFFNLSPKAPELAEWVAGYSDWVQLPQKFGHDEHLWNGVPPYYQWTDNNVKSGQMKGPLRQFLDLFAFELDFSRQSIEFVQDMYHIDKTPMPLLRELGRNFDTTAEQGVGDIRFRAAMSNLAERQTYRGTEIGLQKTIETISKYETGVTTGKNMMLLPDDSSPVYSSGNWAGPHPDLVAPLAALPGTTFDTVVAHDKVKLEVKPSDVNMPNIGEQGFLRMSATITGNVIVTCGCGKIYPPVMMLPKVPGGEVTDGWLGGVVRTQNEEGEYIPLVNGIPVDETGTYGFMAYLRNSVSSTSPRVCLLWFDATGQPSGLISAHVGDPIGGTPVGSFGRLDARGIAPAGAVYLVPAIQIANRPDVNAYVDVTGAMVYQLQKAGASFNVTSPDRLLTLGQINDKIGQGGTKPGEPLWPGFNIGSPIDQEGLT